MSGVAPKTGWQIPVGAVKTAIWLELCWGWSKSAWLQAGTFSGLWHRLSCSLTTILQLVMTLTLTASPPAKIRDGSFQNKPRQSCSGAMFFLNRARRDSASTHVVTYPQTQQPVTKAHKKRALQALQLPKGSPKAQIRREKLCRNYKEVSIQSANCICTPAHLLFLRTWVTGAAVRFHWHHQAHKIRL